MPLKSNEISQEEFERIEKYILKKMTNEEQVSFEQKLNDDIEQKRKLDELRGVIQAVEVHLFNEKMNEFHSGLTSENTILFKNHKNIYLKKFAMAASIAALVGLMGFWYLNHQNSSEQLYSKYFKPDPGLPTVMSSTSEYDFYEAMVDYKRENYIEAIKKWKEILPLKPKSDTLNYFIGVSYLANDQEIQAITYLEVAVSVKESSFRNDIYFYLGLAYLKNDNLVLAKENLKLSNLDKSEKILNKLNKK